jgi:hypothetical protein
MKLRPRLLLAALLAGSVPASAQWVHSFDSKASLDENFHHVSTASNPFQRFDTIKPGEGLRRTSALSSPANGGAMSALVEKREGFSPLTPAWRVGVYFRYAEPNFAAKAGPFFAIGAARAPLPLEGEVFNITTSKAVAAEASYIGLRALVLVPDDPVANVGVVQIGFRSLNAPSENQGLPAVSPFTSAENGNLLVPGRWYHLRLDVTRQDDTYGYEVTLIESDHEGALGRVLLAVSGADLVNTAFAGSPAVHLFLAIHRTALGYNYGVSSFDDFSCSALPSAP